MDDKESTGCWSALYPGLGNAELLGRDLRQRFKWLESLKSSVNRVVNFGCWMTWNKETMGCGSGGRESFALLWTLDATEVVVVEKNSDYIQAACRMKEELRRRAPDCFKSGSIRFLPPSDMTKPIPELPSDSFDLAYCARVLLNIEDVCGIEGVRKAIRLMARVIKPQGFAVSAEAGAGIPYPPHYLEVFEEAGFAKVRVMKIPLGPGMPSLVTEYIVYEKRCL